MRLRPIFTCTDLLRYQFRILKGNKVDDVNIQEVIKQSRWLGLKSFELNSVYLISVKFVFLVYFLFVLKTTFYYRSSESNLI